MLKIGERHPGYLAWVFRFMKLWMHFPVYDGREGEEGGVGVLRYSGSQCQFHCCFLTEALVTIAKKLNMTLEYLVIPSTNLGYGNYMERQVAVINANVSEKNSKKTN